MKSKILINSGPAKIYLQQTAEELERRGMLLALTGSFIVSQNSPIRRANFSSRYLAKILRRSEEIKDHKLIHGSLMGEIYWQIGMGLQKILKSGYLLDLVFWLAALSFSRTAKLLIQNIGEQEQSVYHVRSGFGGKSIALARELGFKIIVDHSIAHPAFLAEIDQNREFRLPNKRSLASAIMNDINAADLVLVNSDFVQQTFKHAGFQGLIRTAIPPIEKRFARQLRLMESSRNELSFIGRCEYRKGIDRVFEIISKLEKNIKINIVGSWDMSDIALKKHFENLKNVEVISFVDQNEIARIMGESRIFLFPSRAEGAARVVSEALHAGCVVFTTLESGIPIPESVGFTINQMSDDEIRKNIMMVMNNDLNLEKNINASRNYIEGLELSYISTLLNVYQEIQTL